MKRAEQFSIGRLVARKTHSHKEHKMERFNINIDNALKARLYELCRLCGMDNKNRITVLDHAPWMYAEGEVELRKKIYDCVGVQVRCENPMDIPKCSPPLMSNLLFYFPPGGQK